MLETTSFDDVQIAVYRGSRAIKTVPGPKTMCYSLRKRPGMLETTSFDDIKIAVYRVSRAIEIVPGPQSSVL